MRPDAVKRESATGLLVLEHFLPYRLSVLSNIVSSRIAKSYDERFQLTIPEWRVMAVLGRFPGLTAAEVTERTAMDKVQVSRAVARLQEDASHRTARGRRRPPRAAFVPDRGRGRASTREIVPLALDYERRVHREPERRRTRAARPVTRQARGGGGRALGFKEARAGRMPAVPGLTRTRRRKISTGLRLAWDGRLPAGTRPRKTQQHRQESS